MIFQPFPSVIPHNLITKKEAGVCKDNNVKRTNNMFGDRSIANEV